MSRVIDAEVAAQIAGEAAVKAVEELRRLQQDTAAFGRLAVTLSPDQVPAWIAGRVAEELEAAAAAPRPELLEGLTPGQALLLMAYLEPMHQAAQRALEMPTRNPRAGERLWAISEGFRHLVDLLDARAQEGGL